MAKQRLALWDVDEVMLDHIGGLRKFVQKHYDIHPEGTPDSYNLVDWLGVDQTKVQEIMKHFNERSYEFGLLEILDPDALQYMQDLKKNFPDVLHMAVTKSGTFGHGEVLRKVNLENCYPGVFDAVHIVEMYESKRSVLHKLQHQYDVQFLVDDYIDNIRTCESMGIKGIMLKAGHNFEFEDTEEFTYVRNWYQLNRTVNFILNK